MEKEKSKLKFRLEMLENGNLRSTASKLSSDRVSINECREFVEHGKTRLDELLARWEELYKPGNPRKEHAS